MHEGEKLAEAEYFLTLMGKEQAKMNRDAFRFNLSAFLNAARSVLQYARKEAHAISGTYDWYDGQIMSSSTLAFFKKKRDANIHEEPVAIVAQNDESFTASASFANRIDFEVRDKDGNLKQQDSSPTTPPSQTPETSGNNHTVRYLFDTWPGPEDALTLCTTCVQELRAVVADGIANGLITG